MGAEHNLPSLENIVMDSPDVKNVMEWREGKEEEHEVGFGTWVSRLTTEITVSCDFYTSLITQERLVIQCGLWRL